ncbi:MAG: YbjN domain-containing protein, partial [Bacteroidetes bacterium]|nr:YbjN domain-containing protein [Bacteroidota bacterium]
MISKFGRFSDAFKPAGKIALWNECDELYGAKKYLEAYSKFFDYLRDDDVDTVFYSLDKDILKFQVIQGSKEIRGFSDGNKVSAIAIIADYDKLSVAVMRRLMELNYTLYYSRFAIKDNRIVLKFDSSVLDCSPTKLYYALKEVCLKADKQDDTLLDDFTILKPAEMKIEPLPDAEVTARVKYLRKWIQEALDKVKAVNKEQFSGGISYLYLNLIYRIDYLLQPHGSIMNDIEKINWNYFNREDMQLLQQLDFIEEQLGKILARSDESVKKNFYSIKSTFGLAPPSVPESAVDVINKNSGNIKWYMDNKHEDFALAILEYIAGYCHFSYGLNKSLRFLFGMVIEIVNQDYLDEIGYEKKYVKD